MNLHPPAGMDTQELRAKVYEMLGDFSTAMFVTTGASGRPEARPMEIAKIEESGDIFFFTGRTGTVATEIEQDSTALLTFQNDRSAYLSLRGRARVIDDSGRHRAFWKEAFRVWFPGGPSDPTLALIGVTPIEAEYWDNRGSNKLKYLVESGKAYVKGEKPEVDDPEQHGKTKL